MTLNKHCNFAVYGLGIFLIILGVVIGLTWSSAFNYILKENLKLSPSSKSYNLWKETPIPLYLDIYLFNWTNSLEFLKDSNVKPKFEEVGPFVFREVHKRVNVIWSNNTVTYNQTRTWFFVTEDSMDLKSNITNLNVVLTSITKMASIYGTVASSLIKFLSDIYKEKLLITKSAEQWLFEGIDDKLLNFIKKILPSVVSNKKFGWFYGRNGSSIYDGIFKVNSGSDDIYSLGALKEWNNQYETKFFEKDCGRVTGSTGELFSPLTELQKNLTIFLSDFCGPITLKYSHKTTIEGFKGYHYIGDERIFDNGTAYPEMKCFCTGKCSPSGVRNETLCRQAPLFISFPHFYLADPYYTNAIEGLKPNKSHQFYIIIEPLSGIPLEVQAQLQVNILLEPLKFFKMFSKVPKVYVPMMWFKVRTKASSNLLSNSSILYFLKNLGWGMSVFLVIVGCIIICIRIVQLFTKKQKEELLIQEKNEELDENVNVEDDNNSS